MTEWTWDLQQIIEPHSFDELFAITRQETEQFDSYYSQLTPSISVDLFTSLVIFLEEHEIHLSQLQSYAGLHESLNETDAQNRKNKTRVNELLLHSQNKQRLIPQWLSGKQIEGKDILDDENAKRLFEAVPKQKYYFYRMRELAKHTLDATEEDIMSQYAMSVYQSMKEMRSLIEFDYLFSLVPHGKNESITISNQSELLQYVKSEHADEREQAYQQLFSVYKKNAEKYFVMYQTIVKEWNYAKKIRNYDSSIALRHTLNDIDSEVVTSLLQSCQKFSSIYGEYFAIKAKLLGYEKLPRFHVYAPLGKKPKGVSFEEALHSVMTSFQNFSPAFAQKAKRVIDEGHIDAFPRKGKRGGAFNWTVNPKVSPYVLLNHTNEYSDSRVIAHELGHAIHTMYAESLSTFTQHASIPLAETASTLAEVLFFDTEYKKITDNEEKIYLLAGKIEESYSTVLRQALIVLFEIEAHKLIENNTTCEELCAAYMTLLKKHLGFFEIPEYFAYEWAYIPHIFNSPFYCYGYSFGELVAFSLYQNYRKDPVKGLESIEKVLSQGGNGSAHEILSHAGFDIRDPQFWENGFLVVKEWIDELKTLINSN